jgi:hypothetical protein
MIDSGWSRIRRHAVATLVVVLGAGVLPVYAASAAPSSATGLSGFTTTRASVRVGGELWDTVTVSPRAARTVTVEYRRAGTRAYHTASVATTSTRGAVTVGLRPPAAGRWQFRAVVPATTRESRFASATRTVVAAGRAVATRINGYATASASIEFGTTVIDDVDISPRAARVVSVQVRPPGSAGFVTQSSATSSRTGALRVVYRPSSMGAWGYRLVVRADATALPASSPTRIITVVGDTSGSVPVVVPTAPGPVTVPTAPGPVTDRTAPGPVTDPQASATRDSVTLSWTNPADADLTGAVVRRAPGATAPDRVTDGTLVSDLPAPGRTVTDTGLRSATQYSYAVFAHDGAPNYAHPATLTITTAPAVTQAILSIRPLGLPLNADNKLTVNTPFRFDASDSLAADGTTLLSGTLDYGDGQTDALTEPFGPVDFWNTEHSYTTTGTRTVKLTVTALDGTTSTTTLTVTVLDPPTTTLTMTSGPAHVGQPVTLTLDTSTPDGTQLISYALNIAGEESFHLTDNTAPPAAQPITFDRPGTYTIAFSVANNAGGAPDASVINIVVAP